MRLRLRRRHPASAKCREHVSDRSERTVVKIPSVVGRRRILIGRDDGEPQVLSNGREVVGNAGPVVENAAHRRIARVPAEYAAGRGILAEQRQLASPSASPGSWRDLMGRRQNKRTAWIENGRGRNNHRRRHLRRGATYQQQHRHYREATGAYRTHVTLHGAAAKQPPARTFARCRSADIRLADLKFLLFSRHAPKGTSNPKATLHSNSCQCPF